MWLHKEGSTAGAAVKENCLVERMSHAEERKMRRDSWRREGQVEGGKTGMGWWLEEL